MQFIKSTEIHISILGRINLVYGTHKQLPKILEAYKQKDITFK